MEPKRKSLESFLQQLKPFIITHLVIQIAPFVLALVAWVSGTMGLAALQNLFVLTIILYIGLIAYDFGLWRTYSFWCETSA